MYVCLTPCASLYHAAFDLWVWCGSFLKPETKLFFFFLHLSLFSSPKFKFRNGLEVCVCMLFWGVICVCLKVTLNVSAHIKLAFSHFLVYVVTVCVCLCLKVVYCLFVCLFVVYTSSMG